MERDWRPGALPMPRAPRFFARNPLTRQQRGVGAPTVDGVAYVLEQAVEQSKEFR